MAKFADRVKDYTTTTGTGAITLAGTPPVGFRSFNTAFGSTSGVLNVAYVIDDGAGNWEVGKGTYDGNVTLTRDTIRSSSNAGAAVNFPAGRKTVFNTPSAEHIDNANIGLQYCQVRVMAMP